MLVYFLILNVLIFIPAYLINSKKSNFLPVQFFEKPIIIKNMLANFIRRYNFDVFRFAADFAFITLLLSIFNSAISISFAKTLVFVYLIIAITYQTYYHGIKYIYNTEPLFINDIILIKRGIGIAFHGFKLWLIMSLVTLLFFGFFMKGLSDAFVISIYRIETISYKLVAFLGLIFLCGLYSIKRYTNFKSVYGFLCFVMPTIKLLENLNASILQRKEFKQLEQLNYQKLNQTTQLQLNIKKNIFFIVVESYGTLVYDKAKFPAFNRLIKIVEGKLNNAAWKGATTRSASPISGGASWLSYSTLLKGMQINSESIYSHLFSDERHLSYFPFMQHLQNKSYETFWLSSMGGFEKIKIPWQRTLRFLGIEHSIKYKDLNYTGKHFGFGPSPPDQYSLHKAYELIKKKAGNNPYAMFWLTSNSHYPWDSPAQVVENWNTLNKKKDNYWIDKELDNLKKYEKAMMYQLQFLTDFILKNGKEEDIFILVGDHQPFHIAELQTTNTPVHIISKDEQFVEAFENFNFSKGLLLNQSYEATLKHAGIHSLLIKILNKVYGGNTTSTFYSCGINDF